MKGLFKNTVLFTVLVTVFSFTLTTDQSAYGIKVEKSITQVKEHLYQVSVKIDNGNIINGIAKYEARLPITADFVKEVSKDQTVNFKVDGRKLKIIWMHIQKNKSYTTVFQFKSKLSIDKLKMNGIIFGHKDGDKFSVEDTTSFIKF